MVQIVEHHENSGHDLNPTEARQAVPLGHMRYVLASSLLAIVIIFAFLWFYGVFV